MKTGFFILLIGCFFPALSGWAQTEVLPNEDLEISREGDDFVFSWFGRAGTIYGLEGSQNLKSWTDLPFRDLGSDGPLMWGFSGSVDRYFVRVRYLEPVPWVGSICPSIA